MKIIGNRHSGELGNPYRKNTNQYKQRINEHSWGFARECDEFAKYACFTLQMASKLTIL